MPQTPNDWNSYLAMLDLSNPTLAAYLRSVLPTLVDAVPPAGEYTTSLDYTTLKPALTGQYVGEVIQKYESMLGPSPELYQAAVASGYLTQEQADALGSASTTGVGSLQQEFAAKGGLRTLAGPYQAARTDILKQALADMQTAAEKASSDAYQLASQTTGQRVTALSNAGNLGLGLVNSGVSRRNAQTAAGAGEGGPLELPAPPDRNEPSIWEKILMGTLPAAVAGGLGLLGRSLGPSNERVNPLIQKEKDQQAYDEWKGQQVTAADRASEERPPGWQGSEPQYSTTNPYASPDTYNPSYGEMSPQAAYGPGLMPYASTSTYNPAYGETSSPSSFAWQQDLPQFTTQSQSYAASPSGTSQGSYGGSSYIGYNPYTSYTGYGGYNDYSSPDAWYGSAPYVDYSNDYSPAPNYYDYGDPSAGYWV